MGQQCSTQQNNKKIKTTLPSHLPNSHADELSQLTGYRVSSTEIDVWYDGFKKDYPKGFMSFIDFESLQTDTSSKINAKTVVEVAKDWHENKNGWVLDTFQPRTEDSLNFDEFVLAYSKLIELEC